MISTVLTAVAFLGALAASETPKSHGLKVIESKIIEDASISYKETTICETTKGVKGYSGYVNLPPSPESGRPSPIHAWFWFFEARNKPKEAPLTLWVQGGPGAPSVVAAMGENGPCLVNDDSKTTRLNEWSWNEKANMLYIDQPVRTGFSYDTLVNGTINEVVSPFIVTEGGKDTNETVLAGTFSSQEFASAQNTTMAAAKVMWEVMQVWMNDFPEFEAKDNKLNIWGESYGGHYVPTFTNYFLQQNKAISSGSHPNKAAQPITVETIGLLNACIDLETQVPFYPEFAVNNTYGIKAINQTEYEAAAGAVSKCLDMGRECRDLGDAKDPDGLGNNDEVNTACNAAFKFCFKELNGAFEASGRNHFDIAVSALGSFPPKFAAGYLNRQDIQHALGVPLNFTGFSLPVSASFELTGDFVRGHNLDLLGSLLDEGVRIAMVYGDRDFQCNWLGGEAISLAVESKISDRFAAAGYANITLKSDESDYGSSKGVVRQLGPFAFARVFDAGHESPWYQPEVTLGIFNRFVEGLDVAIGEVDADKTYITKGPENSFHIKNEMPEPEERVCYFWDMFETCTEEEKDKFQQGTAVTENFILIE